MQAGKDAGVGAGTSGGSGSATSSLRQKLGSILVTLGTRGSVPSRSDDHWRQEQAASLSKNALKELGPSVPLSHRLRVLRELHDIVATKRLEDFAVQALWLGVKDLLEPNQPTEARHAALAFLRAMIAGQLDELGVLRAHFFHVVRQHVILEDFHHCFEIVRTLTESGRSIEYIEQDMGPYLAQWLPRVTSYSRPVDFLTLLVNVVKFNAPYLDEEVLIQLVHGSCVVAKSTKDLSVLELCLEFLNAVVCYSSLPAVSLQTVTATLCHTLNLTRTSHLNLDIMLKLLGTHLGHAAINALCSILKDRQLWQNPCLLRGAVFYIGMSLWGVRRVDSLRVAYVSVLPAIREVSGCEHTIVVYEVVLSLLRLIRKYAHSLHCAEWDVIYSILSNVQRHAAQLQLPNSLVKEYLDVLLVSAELHDDQHSTAVDADAFFAVVEAGLDLQPLPMVLKLLQHRVQSVYIGEVGWIDRLRALMNRFYCDETDTEIRINVLERLETFVCDNALLYEAELLDEVVLPMFASVSDEIDIDVRCRAVQLLLRLLTECGSKWDTSLLNYVNSVLLKGSDVATLGKSEENEKLPDCKTAVFGLTLLLKTKLFSSSDLAGQVFHVLVSSLHQQYTEKAFLPATCVMRIKIFNCILSLRANERGQVGYQDESGVKYSYFYVCQKQEIGGVVLLDYSKALSAVVQCLDQEREWEVLVEVLLGLVALLKDRVLILSAESTSSHLSRICQLLCQRLETQSRSVQRESDCRGRHAEDDLAAYIYPVLSILCTCGTHLDRAAKHALVCSLERGLVGQCAQLCLHALTLSLLEMQSTVTRLLPHILYRMGQVAATRSMAIPVLEFLSSIIPLHRLYNGFVEQQYLSVFAIALSYTNTAKYNTYVVVMAHWVIALWFIRCRIQHRPAVARYINKSLSTLLSVSQELTDTRYRHGSFTTLHSHSAASPASQATKKRADTHSGVETDYVHISSSSRAELLVDLTDLCQDMMARYTYSTISSQPLRSAGAELLVGGGLSKTWLLGNSLVTITTSGQGGGAKGVCTRCKAIKRSLQPNPDNLLPGNEAYLPRRLSVGRHNETERSDGDEENDDEAIPLCSCWCRGWAEVKVRRPTGNVAWLMRVQNKLDILSTASTDVDLSLAAVNMVGLDGEEEEEEEEEDEADEIEEQEWGILTAELTDEEDEEEEEAVVELAQEVMEEQRRERAEEKVKVSHDEHSHTSQAERLDNVVDSSDLHVPSNSSLTQQSPKQERVTKMRSLTGVTRRTGHRKPSSHSWSEGGMSKPVGIVRSHPYSSTSLDALPPLFSYDDEGDGLFRSPSLGQSMLSDPEQMNLLASVSQSALLPSERNQDISLNMDSEDVLGNDRSAGEGDDCEGEGGEPSLTEALVPPLTPPREKPDLKQQPKEEESNMPVILEVTPSLHSTPVPPSADATPPHVPTHTRSAPSSARSVRRVKFTQPSGTSQLHQDGLTDLTDLTNNPSFIFLQLYHSSAFHSVSCDAPLLLPHAEAVERAVKVLDHMPPYDTHKIGVVYVAKGQSTEQDILANTHGSSRYQRFLRGLGQLLQLRRCQRSLVYLGGLDTSGTDGDLCCFWQDDITQVIFHVATLMPTHSTDPRCSNKKLHIGNDYVTIVYNDSGHPYQFGTIKGQFTYAEVQVEPLPGGNNRVTVVVRKCLEELVNSQPYFISDQWLPLLVRQKALLVNLASVVVQSQSTPARYLSNWLGRLRQIRHIKDRCLSELRSTHQHGDAEPNQTSAIPDFTQFA